MHESGKSKVLIISFAIPYPADDGGKVYIFGTIDYLREYYDITLLLNLSSHGDLDNINSLREKWPNVNIQFVDYYTPYLQKKESVRTTVFNRLKSVIKRFHSVGKVESFKSKKELYNLEKSNYFTILNEKLITSIQQILSQTNFDIVQVESTMFLSLINLLPEGPVKLFVEVESRSSLYKDYKKLLEKEDPYLNYVFENTKFLELSYMQKYDYIFALSNDDVRRIKFSLPTKQVLLAPYCVLDEHFRKPEDCLNYSPKRVIFMGSESHPPNRDAMEWFIGSILPKLHEYKYLKLVITGRWSSEFIEKYKNNSQVVFTGFLQDLSQVLKDSILVVPIRIGGGGLRAKVIQAMAFGIPVVSTNLGCEGVGGLSEVDVLIANSEHEFSEAIIRIINDNDLAVRLINNARIVIEKTYTAKIVGEQRKNLYQKLLNEKYVGVYESIGR